MGVVVTEVNISKNTVKTGEQYKISVAVRETIAEPAMYRLPFTLNKKKGGLG